MDDGVATWRCVIVAIALGRRANAAPDDCVLARRFVSAAATSVIGDVWAEMEIRRRHRSVHSVVRSGDGRVLRALRDPRVRCEFAHGEAVRRVFLETTLQKGF